MTTPIKIIPLILCGGSGTRLWPLSKPTLPKQFLRFFGQHSLIESTLLRCRSEVFDDCPIIVGSQNHSQILRDTVKNLGIHAEIILEPDSRDSCAAIIAGVTAAAKRNANAIVMVMAADHLIPDAKAFSQAAEKASQACLEGCLVTFGVKPLSPATGYGYILPGVAFENSLARELVRFVEKPDLETAKYYLDNGYLWNSGNFMFAAKTLLQEAGQFCPEILDAVSKSFEHRTIENEGILLQKSAFSKAPRISFDYAIMEKTSRAAVLPVGYAWSDIGSWDAIAEAAPKDPQGNAIVGHGIIENAQNVFVHSDNVTTVVLGCSDVSVIATPEAILVVGKGKSGGIKSVLDGLKQQGKF